MKVLTHLLMAAALLVAQPGVADQKPTDKAALGLGVGKAIFDVNMESAKKMTLYLAVISETIDDLKRQGVEPDVILAFRGKSVNLITENRDNTPLTDFQHLDRIAEQLAQLQSKGVRVEACSVATRLFKVDNSTLLKGVQPVGNTFVSLIGYQAQGYANIPIY